MAHLDEAVAARFWPKVDKRGPDECWPWMARRDRDGYGQLTVSHRRLIAHRVAWMLARGPIPAPGTKRGAMCVCHHCDNPPCCNPAHLFMGTHADNTADMVAKGRWRGGFSPGETHCRAILSEPDVRFIRDYCASHGYGAQAEMVRRFRVGSSTVGNIVHRLRWSHVP